MFTKSLPKEDFCLLGALCVGHGEKRGMEGKKDGLQDPSQVALPVGLGGSPSPASELHLHVFIPLYSSVPALSRLPLSIPRTARLLPQGYPGFPALPLVFPPSAPLFLFLLSLCLLMPLTISGDTWLGPYCPPITTPPSSLCPIKSPLSFKIQISQPLYEWLSPPSW